MLLHSNGKHERLQDSPREKPNDYKKVEVKNPTTTLT